MSPTHENIPSLQYGTALVLVGPQACGKSTLARELAERFGSYAEIDVDLMGARFDFASVLRQRPQTIIIEGAPSTERQFVLIKELLTNPATLVSAKHGEAIEVPRPHVIICTHEEALTDRITVSRRFNVFLMPVVV